MLKPSDQAPNFLLHGDDSHSYSLKDFRGQSLVLFFYPKDLTPGCTTEACDFSNTLLNFAKLNTRVVGVSRDSLASHARFKSKYSLGMTLLSDPDLATHMQYGAYGPKLLYGKSSIGVIRSTFLIDSEGLIIKAWYKVRVKNHVQAVLEALNKYPDYRENAEGGTRTRTGKPGRF